jgi:hypothetical protein
MQGRIHLLLILSIILILSICPQQARADSSTYPDHRITYPISGLNNGILNEDVPESITAQWELPQVHIEVSGVADRNEGFVSAVDAVVSQIDYRSPCLINYSEAVGIFVDRIKQILSMATSREVLWFLVNSDGFVRDGARERLRELGEIAELDMVNALEHGSPRMKFEILKCANYWYYSDYVDSTSYGPIAILNEILSDINEPVFSDDIYPILDYMNRNEADQTEYSLENAQIDWVEFYIRQMRTSYIPDRAGAVIYLGKHGANSPVAVETLIGILEQPDYDALLELENLFYAFGTIHSFALDALGEIGPSASDAIPTIQSMMETTQDPLVKIGAIKALYFIGFNPHDQLEFLINALADPQYESFQPVIARALGSIGQPALHALPVLVDLMNSENREARYTSKTAIEKIVGSRFATLDITLNQLENPDKEIQHDAINELRSLACQHQQTDRIVEALYGVLDNEDWLIRLEACETIRRYDALDERVVPVLAELLDEHAYDDDILTLLYRLGPIARDAVPALLDKIDLCGSGDTRLMIQTAFMIGATNEEVVDRLIVVAGQPAEFQIIDPIGIIGSLGSKAESALPFLRDVAASNSVRSRSAQEAIERIQAALDSEDPND